MQYQKHVGWCGPAAVVNALAPHGLVVTQKWVAANAGTTVKEGTDHGLLQALERAGAVVAPLSAGFEDAYTQLWSHLRHGGTAVVLTEAGDHWEAAIGVNGPRIVFFNSDRALVNRRAGGVWHLDRGGLKARWLPYAQRRRYAILVSR